MATHTLCFGDQPFRILQLTDIHFDGQGQTPPSSEKDQATLRLISELAQTTTPDLIVMTGDQVYGPKNLQSLEQLLDHIDTFDIPYTLTFGNHDSEGGGVDRQALALHARTHARCLLRSETDAAGDPLPGAGNHTIALTGPDGTLRWLLVMIDSGDHQGGPAGGYAAVDPKLVDWVGTTLDAPGPEAIAPDYGALIFQHIPLPEVNTVWLTQPCAGLKLEGTCPPLTNSGLFHRLVASGHARGVFYGHDHVNDYAGTLHGITLAYGRATGFNTYGAQGFARGGRLIELTADITQTFATELVLDGGTRVTAPAVHKPMLAHLKR